MCIKIYAATRTEEIFMWLKEVNGFLKEIVIFSLRKNLPGRFLDGVKESFAAILALSRRTQAKLITAPVYRPPIPEGKSFS